MAFIKLYSSVFNNKKNNFNLYNVCTQPNNIKLHKYVENSNYIPNIFVKHTFNLKNGKIYSNIE